MSVRSLFTEWLSSALSMESASM